MSIQSMMARVAKLEQQANPVRPLRFFRAVYRECGGATEGDVVAAAEAAFRAANSIAATEQLGCVIRHIVSANTAIGAQQQ